MKKITALLLALLLALSACGKTPQDVSGTITPATQEPTLPSGTVAPATEAPTEEPTEAPTEAPVETTAPAEENPVTMGWMEGGTYTNTYMGFALDLDSTWTYYPAEALQEMPENVKDVLEGTEIGDAINPLNQFTDMMAESVERLATINVLYQKLDMQTRLVYAAMSEENIVDATLGQKDMLVSAYAQAGIENAQIEKVKVNFLGEETFALKTTASTQGVPVYMLQVFDYKLGQYGVTVTFTCYVEDITEELIAMCYPA